MSSCSFEWVRNQFDQYGHIVEEQLIIFECVCLRLLFTYRPAKEHLKLAEYIIGSMYG